MFHLQFGLQIIWNPYDLHSTKKKKKKETKKMAICWQLIVLNLKKIINKACIFSWDLSILSKFPEWKAQFFWPSDSFALHTDQPHFHLTFLLCHQRQCFTVIDSVLTFLSTSSQSPGPLILFFNVSHTYTFTPISNTTNPFLDAALGNDFYFY